MSAPAGPATQEPSRPGLEHALCVVLRPPFAHDAVTALPGGRVRISFKGTLVQQRHGGYV